MDWVAWAWQGFLYGDWWRYVWLAIVGYGVGHVAGFKRALNFRDRLEVENARSERERRRRVERQRELEGGLRWRQLPLGRDVSADEEPEGEVEGREWR